MALSVRTRFEVFKRDDFTCRYCGKKSPDVILEVDHIVPRAEGGSDDTINLATSCWACNSGKSCVPLNQVMTGEDPHDKAIQLLEQQRQLQEYNHVLSELRSSQEDTAWRLVYYWLDEQGELTPAQKKGEAELTINRQDFAWLRSAIKWCPQTVIQDFMDIAIRKRLTRNMRYVAGCCRNWRYEHAAEKPDGGSYDE